MTHTRLDSLSAALYDIHPSKRPPLQDWQPALIVPFDIVIKENGEWYHQGTKMTRQSLVKLFSSVLWATTTQAPQEAKRKDAQSALKDDFLNNLNYYLKTPTTLYQITVEEAPLLVNRIEKMNDELVFITHNDDMFPLNQAHLPFFKDFNGEMRPYVWVHDRLFAKIARTAFYHLLNLGTLLEREDGVSLRLVSAGKTYDMVWQE